MGTHTSKASASSERIDTQWIPKPFIDRVMQMNPDGLKNAVSAWRERYDKIMRTASRASDLKAGDTMDASIQVVSDSATLISEKHAFWQVQSHEGRKEKSRQAIDGRQLKIEKIEHRKDGLKITESYDTAQDIPERQRKGKQYPVHTVTRIIPDDAFVIRQKRSV